MTPQPQQEYIITEEQIQRLFKDKDAVTFATENVCYEVRSRPHTSTPDTCKLVQAYSVCWVDEVLARPDPLALLEAWITKELYMYESLPKGRTIHMIQLLRTNPDAVRQQGIDEGWYL